MLFSRPATSDSFAIPWTVAPPRFLCPWDFLSENTGVGCHFLLQGIFPTQGVNLRLLGRLFPTQGLNLRLLGLLPWQVDSLPLSHLESLHVGYTCFNMCLAQYSQIVSMGMAIRERSGAVEKVLKTSRPLLPPLKGGDDMKKPQMFPISFFS